MGLTRKEKKDAKAQANMVFQHVAQTTGKDLKKVKADARFMKAALSANAPTFDSSVDSTKAILPDMRKEEKSAHIRAKQPRKKANATEMIVAGATRQLRPNLHGWLLGLQDPWGAGYGRRCPVNYNPVPTYQSSVARTSVTYNSLSVNVNSTTELVLFGGHGSQSDTDSMDGTAYHAALLTIDATGRTIGPMLVGAVVPCIGYRAPNLALGAASNSSAVAGNLPLLYDNPLPFVAVSGAPEHTRWKLTSMGVKLQNITPMEYRSGNVTWCQPASGCNYAQQSNYATDPTFGVSVASNVGTQKISWTPRPQDLAYWHTDASLSGVTTVESAGMHIWLNNNTSLNAQSYEIQIVCNWEIAGQNLVAISSPGIHQPADRNIVEPVLEAQKFTNTGAAGAVDIGTAVAHSTTGFALPPRVQEAALKHVSTVGKSVLESIIGAI